MKLARLLDNDSLICAGLLAVTLIVYAQTHRFPMVDYDDLQCIADPHIASGLSAENIRWAFSTFFLGNWVPTAWISFQADASFFNLRPGIMHVENVALHALSVVLLFAMLEQCTGKRWRSAIVAGVFAVHPLHVESVAWIAERRDMLSGPPLFGAIIAFVRYTRAVRRRTASVWYGVSLLLFMVSLLGKATAVTLPALLLLLDLWPLKRTEMIPGSLLLRPTRGLSWKWLLLEKFPFAVISACVSYAAVRAQIQVGAALSLAIQPLSERLTNATVCYAIYLWKFFVPIRLAVFYPLHAWPLSQIAAAGVVLLLITVFLVLRRRPVELVGWFWFLIVLFPVSGIFQAGAQSMADRYMYFPMIGLTVAVVWGIADSRLHRVAVPAGILALILLTVQAHRQTQTWASTRELKTHALQALDTGADLHIQLANLDIAEGDREAAKAEFLQAIELEPANFIPEYDLANLLLDRPAEAVPHYLRALQLRPHQSVVENNLAIAWIRLGETDMAARALSAAISDDPKFADPHANLGMLALQANHRDVAAREFAAALQIDPSNQTALAGKAKIARP